MSFKEFHPPHIYLEKTIYFITARTKDRYKYFADDSLKSLLRNVLLTTIQKYDVVLDAWVILANHYHLLVDIKNKKQFIQFIKAFHGKSAIELNKKENRPGRKIWVNYWDHCIKNDMDFYKHLNYIHHNCVKHGYTKQMERYIFSSYQEYLLKYGKEWLDDCLGQYRIIDFTPQDV